MNRAACSAVFSDGSFCYIPKGTTCPMEISTYFRINNQARGCPRQPAQMDGVSAPHSPTGVWTV